MLGFFHCGGVENVFSKESAITITSQDPWLHRSQVFRSRRRCCGLRRDVIGIGFIVLCYWCTFDLQVEKRQKKNFLGCKGILLSLLLGLWDARRRRQSPEQYKLFRNAVWWCLALNIKLAFKSYRIRPICRRLCRNMITLPRVGVIWILIRLESYSW